jgi:hypothetical protein
MIVDHSLVLFIRAELAELVDAHDSGSCAARLPGSSPGFRIYHLC